MSNSLDPDQARHFVGPDLGPNCLQRLSAVDTSRQRVKNHKDSLNSLLSRVVILFHVLGFGKPVLYIPWIVLQELDSLKQACSKRLPKLVRIRPFLYRCRWSFPSCSIKYSIYGEGHRLKFLNIVGCSRFCHIKPLYRQYILSCKCPAFYACCI